MDLQWVNSQINFSRIAIMVQPLKDEIAALQLESDKATQQKRTLEAQIDELQRSIARLAPQVSRVLFGSYISRNIPFVYVLAFCRDGTVPVAASAHYAHSPAFEAAMISTLGGSRSLFGSY